MTERTKNIPISAASSSQLAEFANKYRGLDVHFKEGSAKILAKLRSTGYDDDTILVEDRTPVAHDQSAPVRPEAKALVPTANSSNPDLKRMVELMIPSQQMLGETQGQEPVWVCVNGDGLYIPRNVRCRIHYRFYHALMNAQEAQYERGPNGELGEMRLVPIHPMMVYHIDPEEFDKPVNPAVEIKKAA